MEDDNRKRRRVEHPSDTNLSHSTQTGTFNPYQATQTYAQPPVTGVLTSPATGQSLAQPGHGYGYVENTQSMPYPSQWYQQPFDFYQQQQQQPQQTQQSPRQYQYGHVDPGFYGLTYAQQGYSSTGFGGVPQYQATQAGEQEPMSARSEVVPAQSFYGQIGSGFAQPIQGHRGSAPGQIQSYQGLQVTQDRGPSGGFPASYQATGSEPQLASQQQTAPPEDPRVTARRNILTKYNQMMRGALHGIQNDALAEAAESLLELSRLLLSSVETLDLVYDNTDQHQARLERWRQFNNTWLALLQKQKNASQVEVDSGRGPFTGRSRISRDMLIRMGNELIELNDSVERWGLVDYECGVWEDQIMEILIPCRDLAIRLEGEPPPQPPRPPTTDTGPSSAAGSKRRR